MRKKLSFDLIRSIELVSLVSEIPNKFGEYDLADVFGVSVQSIRRYAKYIREMGIDIHSVKNKYVINRKISVKILNELITTYLALNSSDKIKNLSLIQRKFSGRKKNTDKTLSMFVNLVKAINRKSIIEIKYEKDISGSDIRKEITPLSLIRTGRTFILVAMENDDGKNMKNFLIERINSVKRTGKTSRHRDNFDAARFSEYSWGIYRGNKPDKVKLLFKRETGILIMDKFYIESQKFYEVENGIMLEMDVYITLELISWILGWGNKVRVLEPASLKNKVLETAREIIEM
ncbi:MAG: WYL domain-containing transcriptional regulator [Ignavibacteria bacterium]|nr:WYL domain-containing transcriptional regulator [Ignavibacteria bacterium]